MGNARSAAVAAESREIEASQSRAIAAREANENRPRTALEAMAQRLSVTPRSLQNTLMNTAFKGCSEAEFVALVIVSNAFDLNPLLREIYAFPKKGGGIQAIVGYDGWIKIAERHPQYDGYEAIHIRDDKGAIEAVEGICYRKDRSHPTKKLVYLKEFKRNTEPWNNSPSHMLDLRCFCQTIRLGLGVSGLGVEGVDDIDGGELRAEPVTVPSSQSLGEAIDDEIPEFDAETGEVPTDSRGMTEVSEEEARALDAQAAGAAEEPKEAEEEQAGEGDAGAAEESPAKPADDDFILDLRDSIEAAEDKKALKAADDRWTQKRAAYDDATAESIDRQFAAKRRELSAEGGK